MNLFKNKIDISKVFDSVTTGVDNLVFSKQEKSKAAKAIADSQVEYLKTTLSENSTRSVTRRYLAIAIMSVFLILVLLSVIVYPFNVEYSEYIYKTASGMWSLVMMVAAFFFGAYMVGNHLLKGKKDK